MIRPAILTRLTIAVSAAAAPEWVARSNENAKVALEPIARFSPEGAGSLGMTGYDNALKRYVATWADSGSTGIMRMTGTYDAATKTYTYEGLYPDPMSGKEKPTRMAVRVVSNDQHVMEWWDPTPDGKWVKVMEITYTRK